MKYKNLTTDVVKEVATELIEENGQTTTLEIKTALRAVGYWTIQSEVSRMMDQLAQEGEFVWQDVGGYRVYNFPVVATTNTTFTLPLQDDDEEHEVWHKGDPTSSLVIVAKSRHAARWQYAKDFDVPYRETRSKKL